MKSKKDPNQYPPGFNAQRVRAIIDHYDNQTEDEALAEDKAFRRRARELRRQKFTKEKIDKILEQEANELCKAGEPKSLKRQVTTLNQLMAELRELNRMDKLRAMQFLLTELIKEEEALLKSGMSYPVWSPYDSFEAANTLFNMLKAEENIQHK